jgi:hypothetical protein
MFQLLVTANILPSYLIFLTLMMEALLSPETPVLTKTTRCRITEDILPIQEDLQQSLHGSSWISEPCNVISPPAVHNVMCMWLKF